MNASPAVKYLTHVIILSILWLVVGCACTRFDTVSVRGPEGFRDAVTNSLGLLKTKSPHSYGVITNSVEVIRPGAHRAMFASARRPRLELPISVCEDSVTWRAGVIAHNVYHSHLFHQSRREHPDTCISFGVWAFGDAESKCLEFQLMALRDIGAPWNEWGDAYADQHTPKNTQIKR